MKISARQNNFLSRRHAARRGERGFLVIALLATVAIMLIYINVNVRLLGNLKRELKLVEQQQIQRLEKIGAQPSPLTTAPTNDAPAYSPANSERRSPTRRVDAVS